MQVMGELTGGGVSRRTTNKRLAFSESEIMATPLTVTPLSDTETYKHLKM